VATTTLTLAGVLVPFGAVGVVPWFLQVPTVCGIRAPSTSRTAAISNNRRSSSRIRRRAHCTSGWTALAVCTLRDACQRCPSCAHARSCVHACMCTCMCACGGVACGAISLDRQRLRYLVSRYAWSTSVFAWEYFNEVSDTTRRIGGRAVVVDACASPATLHVLDCGASRWMSHRHSTSLSLQHGSMKCPRTSAPLIRTPCTNNTTRTGGARCVHNDDLFCFLSIRFSVSAPVSHFAPSLVCERCTDTTTPSALRFRFHLAGPPLTTPPRWTLP